jgi:hypothetical protein
MKNAFDSLTKTDAMSIFRKHIHIQIGRCLSVFLAFIIVSVVHASESYKLVSKDGREIIVSKPFYDGEELKVTRDSDGRTVRLNPSLLTPESWQNLNQEVTARMGLSLDVRPVSHRKDKETEWKTSWGSHDSTYTVDRSFQIRVSSTSYFEKPITIAAYFVTGRDTLNVELVKHKLTRNNPVTYITTGSAEQKVLHLAALGLTYSEGQDVSSTDMTVVVEHADGTIAETYTTNKSALDLVLAYYQSKDK